MSFCLLFALILTPLTALGSETDNTSSLESTESNSANKKTKRQKEMLMEVNVRGRFVSVPDSLLDIWYFNDDFESWPTSAGARPQIRGHAVGIEFAIKRQSANGIFYFEYIQANTDKGYWDDIEEPPNHNDGDFLVPSKNLGLAALGADYAFETDFVQTHQTNGIFGLSLMIGGGLGVAILTGGLERWGPGDNQAAYQRYENGLPSDGAKEIPPVFPLIDVNIGLRFNFGDLVIVRVEGGLHTLLYYGASIGMRF